MSKNPSFLRPIWEIADILGVTLRKDRDDYYEGLLNKKVNFGIGRLTLQGEVLTDVVQEKLASAYVILSDHLWMYLATGGFGSTLYVFDAHAAGLTAKNAPRGDVTCLPALSAIKDHVTAIYKYQDKWRKVRAEDIHKELPFGLDQISHL